MPTNPAGKTLKQPLVDFWGGAEGDAPSRFAAFCKSLPAALMDMPHLKVDGEAMTPRTALSELTGRTPAGEALGAIIAARGICELMAPDEARFRKDR